MFIASIDIPAGVVRNTHVTTGDPLDAAKLEHAPPAVSIQPCGQDVAAKTEIVHIARASGNLKRVALAVDVAPAGGDKGFAVDVQKSTGGGAWASILSDTISISGYAPPADRSVTDGVITSSAYVVDNLYRVVWTVSGSTGDQGQGATAQLFFEERTT